MKKDKGKRNDGSILMRKQPGIMKTIKQGKQDRFNIFGKRYCGDCTKYNLNTTYCNILKKKIKCPNDSKCSWFIRKWEAS